MMMDHHWGQVDGDEDGDGAVGAIEPAATQTAPPTPTQPHWHVLVLPRVLPLLFLTRHSK